MELLEQVFRDETMLKIKMSACVIRSFEACTVPEWRFTTEWLHGQERIKDNVSRYDPLLDQSQQLNSLVLG